MGSEHVALSPCVLADQQGAELLQSRRGTSSAWMIVWRSGLPSVITLVIWP